MRLMLSVSHGHIEIHGISTRKKDPKMFVMIRNISKFPDYLRRHYWCCAVFSTATKFTLLSTYLSKTTDKIHKVICEKEKQFADIHTLLNKG
jgi:hypothetical protein